MPKTIAVCSSAENSSAEKVQPQHVSKVTAEARIKSSIAHRQEAAFQVSWRESRERTLQPRDAALPSAADRREAQRLRVLARS